MRLIFPASLSVAFLSLLWTRAPALAGEARSFKPVTRDGRPYAVRITVGMHETVGWEHALTGKDPSLRHWTWMPIYSFDQAFIGANNKHSAPKRPKHVYVKPNHVPLPVVSHELPVVPPHKYVVPNKVPLPVVEHPAAVMSPPARYEEGWHAQGTTEVSAAIHVPKEKQPVAAKPKTYGAAGDVYGILRHPLADEPLAEAHLHGRLITPKSLY